MSILPWLWPMRSREMDLNPTVVFAPYLQAIAEMEGAAPSADDAKLLAQSWRIFDNDSARRSSIDTRAAAIMPAIGLAATLVSGVGFTVLKDATIGSMARWVILATYIVSLAFLVRTMFLLFAIHGKMYRSTLDPSDLPTPHIALGAAAPAISEYDRRQACRIARYTVSNYKANNRQSDALFAAQETFRNAILAVVLGGIVAGILIFLNSTAPQPDYLIYAAG